MYEFPIFDWKESKYFLLYARSVSSSLMEYRFSNTNETLNTKTEAVSDVVERLLLHLVHAFVVGLMCIPLATFTKEKFLSCYFVRS